MGEARKAKVLIVDDEKDIREGLADMLGRSFLLTVEIADNGYHALERIQSAPFDVVFLDISMPGISGREVLMRIRELLPQAAVFVLTRWDSDVIAQEIAAAGAEYIPKPFSAKIIKKVLGEKLKALGFSL